MFVVLIVLLALALMAIAGHWYAAYRTAQEMAEHPAPGVMVEVHGEKMHVLVQGEKDAPMAVLLSGWGTAVPSNDYQPLVRALQEQGMATAIVEKFGYGYSDRTRAPRKLDDVIEEMREALAKAGVKPPYILCGHSMSGTELVRWSCLHPEEVRGTVFIDAPAPLAYTHVPLPPAIMCYVQTALCWCGVDRLMSHTPKYFHRADPYMNGFQLLTEAELARTRVFERRNAANPVCLRELMALRKNARTAGGHIPQSIPVVMCIASGTHETLWDKLQPEEDEFIRQNHAREVIVEGLHNLQHYAPQTLAREIAALAQQEGAVS